MTVRAEWPLRLSLGRRDLLLEVDTQPCLGVGAEGEAIVGKRHSGANGSPPAVSTGDMGLVDVAERGVETNPTEGGR